MKTVSSRDIGYAFITGLTAGIIAWMVLTFLQSSLPYGLAPAWLVLVIPVLWILGVQLGYVLGMWFGFFDQFGKYVAIGFTNFAVDAGVLNLLLSLTHATAGPGYVIQKSVSFLIAVTHSYYWNRRWAFQSSQSDTKGEFTKFMIVNLVALVVNVGVAFAVLHVPHTNSAEVWANISAIAGSGAALIFSFIGFKLVVFKNHAV